MDVVLGNYRSEPGLWDELISLGTIHKYHQRTLLNIQGESSGVIFCLLSGKLKVIRLFPDGKERLVYIGYPPFIYGEYSYLSKWCNSPWRYPGCLIAEKNTVISAVPQEKAFAHFGERLDFIRMLIRIMFVKDSSLFTHSVSIGRSISFEQKLANILVNLNQFILCLNDERPVDNRISQLDLSGIMSTSRPSITRQLKKFASMGLVETSRYGVKVIDKAGLEKIQQGY